MPDPSLMPNRSDWRLDCEVALTPAEVLQMIVAAERERATRSTAISWRLFAWAVAAGFLFAVLTVIAGIVQPQKAGLIAVGGFLACLSGQWLYAAAWGRIARQRLLDDWDLAGRQYRLTLDGNGLTWTIPGSSTHIDWQRMKAAAFASGMVQLWTERGNITVIPERFLPSEWPSGVLVPLLTECIRRSRSRDQRDVGAS